MTDAERLEATKKQYEASVSLRDSLVRLQKTRDFNAVFVKELFQTFAAECVLARGNTAIQSNPSGLAAVDRDIAMIGALSSRLDTIIRIGDEREATLKYWASPEYVQQEALDAAFAEDDVE